MERELDGKEILIKPETVTCASHGEHFRARWPEGWAVFALQMFQCAVASRDLERAVRRKAKKPIGSLSPHLMNQVFAEKPMCCFVSREDIHRLLIETDLLTRQRCDVCGAIKFAGPYDYMVAPQQRVTEIVCVDCCLDAGDREHAGRWGRHGRR